ncbi:MAG TPA: hypothetical protein VGU63_13105, partial [Candidatus Acidoferrales bacterium]|nr:hypothetical protein [Candidatus Acidoferrales bacterium]
MTMQAIEAEQSTNSRSRGIIFVAALLTGILAFGLVQPASAQTANQPLSLFRNYLVTGDYVVGGVGLRGTGQVDGFAHGTISIPDTMQAQATGVLPKNVPAGADVLAAYLYWETVESSTTSFAGQNGFFNGYPISGAILGNMNAPVSWSSGGCSGASQGAKTMRTYRADVRPLLPLDLSGRVQIIGSYPVKLADSGSNGNGAPLTLGATLVIVYRLGSPSGPGAPPLKSIVIYDGAFAPSNNVSSDFMQQMVGFYQSSGSSGAEMTQIVGNGQPSKSETVSLGGITLDSIYNGMPPFPGIYGVGSWDNPTWFLDSTSAVQPNLDSITTMVAPTQSNGNCVNWGAVIFGTNVPDSDNDGLLDKWKVNQGYNSVSATNNDYSGPFVALPGAKNGEKDIFVEVDWLSNLDGSAGTYR